MASDPGSDSSFGISRIVDVKIEGGIQMYKVEWVTTWESSESLISCQHLIDQFWSRVNNAKQQEHVAQQYIVKAKQQLHGLPSNILKTEVNTLIERTNATTPGFSSPSSRLQSHSSSFSAAVNHKPTTETTTPTTIPPPTSDAKGSSTASLKYIENFDNPYVKLIVACKICNKEQSTKWAKVWRQHYLTHSDKKAHQCPHCTKSFHQTNLLNKLLQAKHPNKGDMVQQNASLHQQQTYGVKMENFYG